MLKSLYILFNSIKRENQIPKKWRLTTVKSILKGGVRENIQENQRDIFLVSKIYESPLKYKMKTIIRIYDQCKQQEKNKDHQ